MTHIHADVCSTDASWRQLVRKHPDLLNSNELIEVQYEVEMGDAGHVTDEIKGLKFCRISCVRIAGAWSAAV